MTEQYEDEAIVDMWSDAMEHFIANAPTAITPRTYITYAATIAAMYGLQEEDMVLIGSILPGAVNALHKEFKKDE